MSSSAFAEAWALLPEYLSQHVLLSFSAIALGALISLPLGIASAHAPALRGSVLAFASVLQTIPGLALLALFYPILLAVSALTLPALGLRIPALGFLPALLALTLYSMLPILRNTITGIRGVDPAIRTAAKAVGMTHWQSLRIVEVPLAAPFIMAGVRISAVWVIGTATLSTPVGEPSLGNYIFTGLQTENWIFVLFGCVAAGLLALIVDRALALAEIGFAKRSPHRVVAAALALLFLVAGSIYPLASASGASLVIGAKTFEEQYILSALLAHRLTKAGYSTTRHNDLGSTVIFRALAGNDLDLYVDYSGTIWTNQMHRADIPPSSIMLPQISRWLRSEHGIVDLGSLGFENAYVLAMRRDKAAALGITSLADLGVRASHMILGGDYEFFSRPEWKSVAKAYDIRFAKQRTYQPTFMYRALMEGDVDVIAAFSSDGRIAQYGLTLLSDPRGALPSYDALLLLSPKHAGDTRMISVFASLIGGIRLPLMQQANLMVDRDKRTPDDVGYWLESQISR